LPEFDTIALDGEKTSVSAVAAPSCLRPWRQMRPATPATSRHPAWRVRAWPWPAAGFLARGLSPRTTFPGSFWNPQWYVWSSAIRLQLRGQPRNGLLEQAHRIPLDSPCGHHHRKPWHLTVMASTVQSSNMRKPGHGKIRFDAACHPC